MKEMCCIENIKITLHAPILGLQKHHTCIPKFIEAKTMLRIVLLEAKFVDISISVSVLVACFPLMLCQKS